MSFSEQPYTFNVLAVSSTSYLLESVDSFVHNLPLRNISSIGLLYPVINTLLSSLVSIFSIATTTDIGDFNGRSDVETMSIFWPALVLYESLFSSVLYPRAPGA